MEIHGNLWADAEQREKDFALDKKDDAHRFQPTMIGSRGILDACVMASKLTYEKTEFIRNVVINTWKVGLIVELFYFVCFWIEDEY
jgi:hypothetical protein